MSALKIQLLGTFRVAIDDVPIDEAKWGRKKARTLLKLLALAPGFRMHREQLIEILWPDTDAELALNNFHKVVHAARRALEPELRQGGSSGYLLTQDLWVLLAPAPVTATDLHEFEQSAAEALRSGEREMLESALSLYTGDLLEEDLYEDWASLPRERVRLLYQQILERLGAQYEAQGDERAVEILNRLVSLNPSHEDAHRSLMRVYAATGRRQMALNQFRVCRDAIKNELDAAPEPATVALYEQIVAGAAGVAAGEPLAAVPAGEPVSAPAAPSQPRRRRTWLAAIAASLLVAALGVAWLLGRSWATNPSVPPSLAIIPLRFDGGGPQLEYMADGVTENLINLSSRMAGVRVMARATVFAYKGRTDARNIGKELKVTNVLYGRVRQSGNDLAISVELIDVADGARIWGRQFSGSVNGLPALQQSLADEVLAALDVKVTSAAKPPTRQAQSTNPDAYRLYVAGRYYWNKRTEEGLRKSLEYYEQAIDKDPLFALAYAGLADSFGLLGFGNAPPADYFPRARAAAQKALELDDHLAEAHTSLAMIEALFGWNWPKAELEYRRAIDLNPGYAVAHHWYGVHLGAMGRFGEARAELAKALELDPLSPIINLNSGYPLYYERRFAEASALYRKALDINPNFALAHEDLMLAAEQVGDADQANQEAVKFLRASGDFEMSGALERDGALRSHQEMLKKWLDFELKRSATGYVPPMRLASLAVRLGDRERAIGWLERAYREHSPPVVYIAVDPQYAPLRNDPRFQTLIRQLSLKIPN